MQPQNRDDKILDIIKKDPRLQETIKKNHLLGEGDYKEKPVDIIQFIEDPHYLGNATDCGKKVYKVWKDALWEAYMNNSIIEVILTGAIGCLGPDVKISLLDGRELTIPEIMEERSKGKQHWVYSYDIKMQKMMPGRVTDALLSGKNVRAVRVTLDNGEQIVCTDNHPFLLKDGRYVEAKDLNVGMSLRPLYRTKKKNNSGGHYEYFHCGGGDWMSTHNHVGDIIHGRRIKQFGDGECYHHRDFNRYNNNPENLQKMSVKEHWKFHSSLKDRCLENLAKANTVRWTSELREQASKKMHRRNVRGLSVKALRARWTPEAREQKKLETIQYNKRHPNLRQDVTYEKIEILYIQISNSHPEYNVAQMLGWICQQLNCSSQCVSDRIRVKTGLSYQAYFTQPIEVPQGLSLDDKRYISFMAPQLFRRDSVYRADFSSTKECQWLP